MRKKLLGIIILIIVVLIIILGISLASRKDNKESVIVTKETTVKSASLIEDEDGLVNVIDNKGNIIKEKIEKEDAVIYLISPDYDPY